MIFCTKDIKIRKSASLEWIEYELISQLQCLKDSLNFNESLVESKISQLDCIYDELRAEYPEDYFSYIDYCSEMQSINDLRLIYRSSCLLMAFSIIESKIEELCRIICIISGHKIRKVSKNSFIEIFSKYLEQVFGKDINVVSDDFSHLEMYKLVRNSFTHANGIMTDTQKNRISALKNLSIVSTNNSHQIQIKSREFLDELLSLMESIFTKILDNIDNKLHEMTNNKNCG